MPCATCQILRGQTWEIEYEPGNEGSQSLPDALGKLSVYQEGVGRWQEDTLYQCPKCKTFFVYKMWTPGGSDDAMRTWIHEAVWKVDDEEAKSLAENASRPPHGSPKQRCPNCRSTDIETVDVSYIGAEGFVTLRCRACGKEEILDEYQLDSWYS